MRAKQMDLSNGRNGWFRGAEMSLIFVAALVLGLTLVPPFAEGGNKSGPRPGENDTISAERRSLFKDNEAALLQIRKWDQSRLHSYYLHPKKDDLSVFYDPKHSQVSLPGAAAGEDYRPMAADSGRVESHTCDSVVSAWFGPGQKVNVAVWDQTVSSVVATWEGTGAGAEEGNRSVDVAVADLDNVATAVTVHNTTTNKDETVYVYYDEIAVVRTVDTPEGRGYQLDVLSFSGSGSTAQLTAIGSDSDRFNQNVRYVAVTAGDFDGDMQNELAIVVAGLDGHAKIIWYRLSTDDNDNRKFEKMTTTKDVAEDKQSLDMTAGDFDGDGCDELCLVRGDHPIRYYILKLTKGTDNQYAWVQRDSGLLGESDSNHNFRGDLRVVSGLFKLDPTQGFRFDMKQILVAYASYDPDQGAWPELDNHIRVVLLDARNLDNVKTLYSEYLQRHGDGDYASHRHIDVAAGNFVGHGQDEKAPAQSPVEQAMIAYQWWEWDNLPGPGIKKTHASVTFFRPVNNGQSFDFTYYHELETEDCGNDTDRYYTYFSAVAAPDVDGDTWVLGVPWHIVVNDYLGMDFYIQEPPKHVDFLPMDPNDWTLDPTKWGVINISAYDDFYMELRDSTFKELSSNSTNTSSFDMGGSLSWETEAGFNLAGIESSMDVKAKISYDYKSAEASSEGTYHSESKKVSQQTNEDDALLYRYQVLDIWRYPIFGFDTGDSKNPIGMYELVFPGPKEGIQTTGKMASDWFHPSHTNQNLLSYPPGEDFGGALPDDLGKYDFIDTDGQKIEEKIQTINDPCISRTYDGNEKTFDITWTDGETSGLQRSWNNTLSESIDIKYKVGADVEQGWGTQSTVKIGFHSSQSWGGNEETTSTMTESTGISLTIPKWPIEQSRQYDFNTAVYFNKAGTVKVIHGPRFTSLPSWWQMIYAYRPDPGLNLPNRFLYHVNTMTTDYWTLQTDNMERMKAREIYLTESTKSAFSKEGDPIYDPIYRAVLEGETVRLCAVIHNYSLAFTPAGPFKVRFEYVAVNPVYLKEESDRKLIDEATVESLGVLEAKEAAVLWTPRNLWNAYPAHDASGNIIVDSKGQTVYCGFRFYVTVDPENEVQNEIHEWKDPNPENAKVKTWADDTGRLHHGNNEGYWPWNGPFSVLKPGTSGNATSSRIPHEVSMHVNSLSIYVDGQGLTSGRPVLEVGETYRLRIHIQHSATSSRIRHVLVYEDDPSKTNKAIGDHLLYGNSNVDSYVWCNWTPRKPGEYHLHARVMEDIDDPIPNNAQDSLQVTVMDTAAGGGGDSSGCFIDTLMH